MTYPGPQQPGPQPSGQFSYPPPPTAKKRVGAGKILLIVAGVAVLLCVGGIIAAAAASSGSKTTTASGTTNGGRHVKQGQAARDGKFEFTVTAVTPGKTQIGDQYLNKKPQGQFVLVNVTVKNIGGEAQTFSGGNQFGFGPAGAKYTDDVEAETYANSGTQTFLNTINPGNQVTGTLVFDIPAAASLTRLELHDSPFSGGVTVDLS